MSLKTQKVKDKSSQKQDVEGRNFQAPGNAFTVESWRFEAHASWSVRILTRYSIFSFLLITGSPG